MFTLNITKFSYVITVTQLQQHNSLCGNFQFINIDVCIMSIMNY